MLAAIPAAQLASAKTDAIAVRAKPAALDAEVQKHTVQFLQPAAPRGAWMLVSGLTFCWLLASLGQRRRGE